MIQINNNRHDLRYCMVLENYSQEVDVYFNIIEFCNQVRNISHIFEYVHHLSILSNLLFIVKLKHYQLANTSSNYYIAIGCLCLKIYLGTNIVISALSRSLEMNGYTIAK
jgi:hypothetical protein